MDPVKEIILVDFTEKYRDVPGFLGADFETGTIRVQLRDRNVMDLMPYSYYSEYFHKDFGIEYHYPQEEVVDESPLE